MNQIGESGFESDLEYITNKTRELRFKRDPPVSCRDKPTLAEDGSFTVCVHLGLQGPLTLHGFKASDTISDVKARVCQEAMNLGLRPLHPDTRSMESPKEGPVEDDQTLASLPASFYDSDSEEFDIFMCYLPSTVIEIDKETEEEGRWLSLCKRVRYVKEAHEDEDKDENNDDYYKYIDYTDPVSIVKRPKTIHAPLPLDELSDLGIHGQYKLLDSSYREMPVSKLMFAISVQTTASVILLAPNDVIRNHLVCLNRESKYLVVRVSWDRLSYFFLRTLRTSCPDIPIVAVTDLDPHHLDLLTFLDTPPDDVSICYGWDLCRYFTEVYSTDIDFVDIKWLGLRHTDCDRPLTWEGDVRPPPPPGFHEVICMLMVNPFLRRKKDWLEALYWLNLFGRSVSLLHPARADPPGDCYLYFEDNLIVNKLSKKDWV